MPYVNKLTANLEKLVELIDADYELVVVPVHTDKSAKKADCYTNVKRRVDSFGGSIQLGWVLIENDWMVEAEHHAVWEKKDGSLVDITPRETPVRNVLFIPDDRIEYKGITVDNIRLNTTGNILVDDFIQIAEMDSLISENGTRLNSEKVELGFVASELYRKYRKLGGIILQFFMTANNGNSACFCGSGDEYANCHHLIVNDGIAKDKGLLPKKMIKLFDLYKVK